MIKNLNMFLNEGLRMSQKYLDSFHEFVDNFLEELRKDMVGKTVYIRGKSDANKKDCHKIKVASVSKDDSFIGRGYETTLHFNARDEDGNYYSVKEILTEEEYDKYMLKMKKKEEFEKEKIRKAEELKLKMKEIDPYGEEDWNDENKNKPRRNYSFRTGWNNNDLWWD